MSIGVTEILMVYYSIFIFAQNENRIFNTVFHVVSTCTFHVVSFMSFSFVLLFFALSNISLN